MMMPFPAGERWTKSHLWDINSLLICPKCERSVDNYRGFYIDLTELLECENCQHKFNFEEGFRYIVNVENPILNQFFFSFSYTIGSKKMKIGEPMFLDKEDLGLDFIQAVNILNDQKYDLVGLYRIEKEGVIIGLTNMKEETEIDLTREYDINYMVSGKLLEIDLPIWRSLLYQSSQMLLKDEYTMALFLGYTSFEALVNRLTQAYIKVQEPLPKKIRKNRGINIIKALTNNKITEETENWRLFNTQVKRIRNKIAHEAYTATKEEAKEALVRSVLFIVTLLQNIPENVINWQRLPDRRTTAKNVLFGRELYQNQLIQLFTKWDSDNAEILAHQAYVNTAEGKGKLLKRIKRFHFGKCPKCKRALIPLGRRNKPGMANLRLECIKCGEGRNLKIDGAYFGTWAHLEVDTVLRKTILRSNISPVSAGEDKPWILESSSHPPIDPQIVLGTTGNVFAKKYALGFFEPKLFEIMYGELLDVEAVTKTIKDRIINNLPAFIIQSRIKNNPEIIFCLPIKDEFGSTGSRIIGREEKLTEEFRETLSQVIQAIWRLIQTGKIIHPKNNPKQFEIELNEAIGHPFTHLDY